jgi:ActR/RegA family two-component response regulator
MTTFSTSFLFLLLVFCLIGSLAADDLQHKSGRDVCSGGSDLRTPDIRLNRPTDSVVGNCPTEASPLVMADDEKYGNKMVISLTPRLYDYVLNNVREHEILKQLREETAISQIQVSPDQAQLLAMLVEILGAKRCIEVGVYTGYSSLAVALVLPESGRLVACDKDANALEVAKRYYELAGVSHKVTVKHGLAAESLMSMIQNGEESR